MDSIFDLFKTVKLNANNGTGIGLSIVKRLVKKLKGEISVVSEKDKGSEFSFTVGNRLLLVSPSALSVLPTDSCQDVFVFGYQ